ncbi:MAG: hypothetical protein ACT4TC_03390 [Myxococcaceae bacterium]
MSPVQPPKPATGPAPAQPKVTSAELEKAAKKATQKLSDAELKSLGQLTTKDPSDKFSAQSKSSLEGFTSGSTSLLKGVGELVPDLTRLTDPKEISKRFGADFTVLKDQLLDRALDENEKADRAFEFLSKYAERFVELATKSSPVKAGDETSELEGRPAPEEVNADEGFIDGEGLATKGAKQTDQQLDGKRMSREDQAKQAHAFATVAEASGFAEIRDHRTGKTGTELVFELTRAKSVQEFHQRLSEMQVKAAAQAEARAHAENQGSFAGAPPVREASETAAPTERRVELEAVQNRPDGVRVQPWQSEAGKVVMLPVEQRQNELESPSSSTGGSNKRLGSNMVWNLLHRFRGKEQEESALARDVWDKIALGAILFLFGTAILVVILVSL